MAIFMAERRKVIFPPKGCRSSGTASMSQVSSPVAPAYYPGRLHRCLRFQKCSKDVSRKSAVHPEAIPELRVASFLRKGSTTVRADSVPSAAGPA
jgi:hypothetical protein